MTPFKELIQFASYLTGHDEQTIKQMYHDWKLPKIKPAIKRKTKLNINLLERAQIIKI